MKHLKKSLILTTTAFFLSMPVQAAENYNFDLMHTNIVWKIDHFGFSSPSGRFGIKSGKLVLDEKDMKNSSVDVVIDVAGVSTGIDKFNEDIKSEYFLNTAKYPTATFKSTKVEAINKRELKVTGDLTLHGVTKSVVLKVRINKIGVHPILKKKAAGFSAATTIKRSEFGIDKYVPNVSDDVRIEIEAEAALS